MSVIETPMSHAEAALKLVEELRKLQGSITGFGIPPKPLDSKTRPRGQRSLPNQFFDSLAIALESSQTFAATVTLTPAEIRDMLRFCEAYVPIAEELERFARGVRYMVAVRRAEIGRRAVSAYRIAQGINLQVDISAPVPEVDAMARAVTRRRKEVVPKAQTKTS